MNLNNIGEIIALRKLYLTGEKDKTIAVSIGKPQQFPDSQDYYCPFQITGIGSEKIKYAGGVDAIQAIQLAFDMIGVDLYVLNKENNGRIRWEADRKGSLGFPHAG